MSEYAVAKPSSYTTGALLLALAVILYFVPSFTNGFWIQVLIIAVLYVPLVMSLNLVIGFTGLLDLGHGAFFGIGAYTLGILSTLHGWPFWFSFLAAGALSGALGLLIGALSLRLRGHYFAIATLAFAVIVYTLFNTWLTVTRGPQGIPGIPTPPALPLPGGITLAFTSDRAYFYLACVFAAVCGWLMLRIISSPIGEALKAIREDELLARSLGLRTSSWKLLIFIISSAFAGLTGALYAGYVGIIEPASFDLAVSLMLVAMVIVGGSGTLLGSVLGAVVLTVAPQALREVGANLRLILFGLALVLTVLFFPDGLDGLYEWAKRRAKRLFHRCAARQDTRMSTNIERIERGPTE